jgi:hypothetical protein
MLQLKNFRLQIYDIEYPFVKSLRIKDFITLNNLIIQVTVNLTDF